MHRVIINYIYNNIHYDKTHIQFNKCCTYVLLLCSSIVKAQNKSVTELKECYCEFIVINHVRLKSLFLSLTLIFFVSKLQDSIQKSSEC